MSGIVLLFSNYHYFFGFLPKVWRVHLCSDTYSSPPVLIEKHVQGESFGWYSLSPAPPQASLSLPAVSYCLGPELLCTCITAPLPPSKGKGHPEVPGPLRGLLLLAFALEGCWVQGSRTEEVAPLCVTEDSHWISLLACKVFTLLVLVPRSSHRYSVHVCRINGETSSKNDANWWGHWGGQWL